MFLNIKVKKTPIPPPSGNEQGEPPLKKPSILGIGVPGGFDTLVPGFEYTHIHSLVVLPEAREIVLPDENLPAHIQLSIAAVLKAESVAVKDDFAPWYSVLGAPCTSAIGTPYSPPPRSDSEARQLSPFALSLIQHHNGVQIAPTGWKCTMYSVLSNRV